ncbi:hypothetical protein [Bacillus wiedmannii]|uniref:hypothetical protein n=1 Tax=Bacillus wiedmannii TaxID=1890302 RepID=UPI000BF92D00|nr:hypothetical protein [Bacillus wiedmannii]PEP21499.1 hypothetical protein CN580_21235 [Bacillus wiedmannii]
MTIRNSGRRRAGDSYRSVNSTQGLVSTGYQIYSYSSPQVTLECEKLSDDELNKLSGEVKVYKLDDLKEKENRNEILIN